MSQPSGPLEFRTDIAHPARVYDYWLGGKSNFAADRDAAEWALRHAPEMLDYARANRHFLARVVRFCGRAGIRQFLDLGCGLPHTPNVHDMARAVIPDARVVYVDNDPIAFTHCAVLSKDPLITGICADLREAGTVLAQASQTLDLAEPVALLLAATLHHITDEDDPAGIVARYLAALAPGSYLALSHLTDELAPARLRECEAESARRGVPLAARGKPAIEALFNGRQLVSPGLVRIPYWRPDGDPCPNADRVGAYGGVAVLPRGTAPPSAR
jgi:SAM-dependent methyltransferase